MYGQSGKVYDPEKRSPCMGNAYIRTVTYDKVTLTPLDAVEIELFGRCVGIKVVDEMAYSDQYPPDFRVFPETVQLCVELDGDLYTWCEWEGLNRPK